ncbi:SDR family NAD(P)-dependent oxidoreductase [Halapricum desulfuricans]|uniref:Short-chain alcohol dehydrogenase n=1 Tax=Halapricum desulfuricans TaxID=2841257 RepID=A0A897NYC8_9EURY|nr:SDR family oxidoreductase [Halapricum desulfuricans]QSG15743.1 Short-chain alcohol dehydrogenase [Halapricum desulfuricans]
MHHFDFEDRVVAVTGAASGIGRETARQFAAHGASVVVADVDDESGEAVVDEIESDGGDAVYVHTDVTNMDDVEGMVRTAVDEFGRLDYAVNNAGIGGQQAPAGDLDEDSWGQVVDINLNGVWRSQKAELEQMTEQDDGGVIINMASVLGKVGFENSSAYVSAKHGVLGLTKTAAWEYADQDIRVNAVCPGFIETQMLAEGGITENEEIRRQIESMHSQDRLGQPEEIADAVMWLCSDGASFTNGEALTVDSGFTSR